MDYKAGLKGMESNFNWDTNDLLKQNWVQDIQCQQNIHQVIPGMLAGEFDIAKVVSYKVKLTILSQKDRGLHQVAGMVESHLKVSYDTATGQWLWTTVYE